MAELQEVQITEEKPLLPGQTPETAKTHSVETPYGSVTFTVYGTPKPKRPAIFTYHDVGLNYKSCFQPLFRFGDMQEIIQNFVRVHVDAPGMEEGAPVFPLGYQYPSLDQLADMIPCILQYLNFSTIIGVGVGAGAYILSRYALNHPDTVEGLVLINIDPNAKGWMDWAAHKLTGLTSSIPDMILGHLFSQEELSGNSELIQKYRGIIQHAPNLENIELYWNSYNNRRDLNFERGGETTLKCPVMLVVGDQAPHEDAVVECNSKLDPTQTSFLKMADSGGQPQLTQPGKLTEAFKYFLQGMGYMASSCMTPKHFPEVPKPTGKMLSDSRPDQPPVYLERLELIRNTCKEEALRNLSHTEVSKFVLDRIFVCDKHKILFCQTPKVGNTQWKKVLIVLNGAFSSIEEIPENVVHDHEKNGLPRLSSFSKIGIQKRLKTYFKFFIVRDPFERLISAFKDKFVHNPRFEPWYRHEIAPGIIRKYRKNRTETRGIQFEDFVRYLGDPNRRWLDLQFGDHIIHWVTYVELCAPCEIKYSVVGHHETLEADAPYILKEAGIDHLVSYPTIPPGITMYNRTKVEQYFLGISKRDIRRLYARFEGDFKLFGYQKPDFLLN